MITAEAKDFFLNKTVSAFVKCNQLLRSYVSIFQLPAELHIARGNILLEILLEELLNWVLAAYGSPA